MNCRRELFRAKRDAAFLNALLVLAFLAFALTHESWGVLVDVLLAVFFAWAAIKSGHEALKLNAKESPDA